jgi:hypothetical protein
MTIVTVMADVAAGVFAGACTYVSMVEHPARQESGGMAAIKHFGPSARRAAVMQGGLAMVSLAAGVLAWFQGSGAGWLWGGLLFGVLVPFTLIVIMPVNRRLLDARLDPASPEVAALLSRWGRLHAARTVVGLAAFVAFVVMSVRP